MLCVCVVFVGRVILICVTNILCTLLSLLKCFPLTIDFYNNLHIDDTRVRGVAFGFWAVALAVMCYA